METIHRKIFGLSRPAGRLALAAAVLLLSAGAMRAQLPPGFGSAKGFSSVEYFPEGPFDQQIKTSLAGAESKPVPGANGQVEIKQLRIEDYGTNGRLELVITAPQCVYSTTDNTAWSAGPIRVESGDGKSTHSGTGFFWRQTDTAESLVISNDVKTVISGDDLPASQTATNAAPPATPIVAPTAAPKSP